MNKERRLTKEEIENLFSFVKSKNVPYIDLQHEIVDHLASGIEDEITSGNAEDYDGALKLVYRRFPITGFAMLIEEKRKALRNYWLKKHYKALLDFCFSKKLFFILLFLVTIYKLTHLLGAYFLIAAYGASLIYIYSSVQFFNKHLPTKKDSYLFIEVLKNSLLFNNYTASFIFIFGFDIDWMTLTPYKIIYISIWITFNFLYSYFFRTNLLLGLKEEIQKNYAHLSFKSTAQ